MTDRIKGYASGTTVSVERSRAEIESVLRRYGATAFISGFDGQRAFLGFVVHHRNVRFVVTMPSRDDALFLRDGRGSVRAPVARQAAADAEEKRRWRCLLLAIKAKLEVVESGIASFEEEFLAHIVLPGGETVGARIAPEVARAYESGEQPLLMLSDG